MEGLFHAETVESQKLQLSNYINEGTWDFFLAYQAKDATGDTSWRPCKQDEDAKDQYRRTFTISRESDGSYTATEEASSNQPKLELVAGSAKSNIVGYEKSQISLQLRNTGRIEYFEQLYLFARKAGENQFRPILNILPAIEAGGQERVTFDIDRFPYGSGDVELEVGYFVKNDFTLLWSNTVSVQPATDVRTAYVLSSDQPVTANLSNGALSQIRIRNVGTTTASSQGRIFYRWELSKGDRKATSEWTKIAPIPAGEEVTFTPNLKNELRNINAKDGDKITLTATFVEVNNDGYIIGRIPILEQGSLAVTCEGKNVITMTTTKSVGESISLAYLADSDVSIEGAEGAPRPNESVNYTLTSQQVTLRGDIIILFCYANQLTDIDVSQCSSLSYLFYSANEIRGKSMLHLVNSLPDRTGLESGTFIVSSDGSLGPEGNVCLKSDVAIARAKNWEVALARVENRELKLYRYDGEDPTKTFAVTLTKVDNGSISATGADDLNAVLEGTELTISDHPEEGYELTALTANGKDILSTKRCTVTEATEVKATFTKKTFAVMLTKEGKGTLTATGADNLNAVPYGTELTIVATPAEGYELPALTANGEDILGTKQFTVKEATEVKATFTKKTFAVTLTKEGEGTLTATGADDLNAVPYGTELTIVATPADGYELTALTANGEDILDSKHVTVTEATTVKATFSKKSSSFKVTLTKEGEGTLTATGADDLNAVLYGTELTIVATPAEGYELTALTANGEDILDSKHVTVTGATTVKATFAKKSFAVKLTKEGEGTLTTTGADNLNAVPYGTELTIVATPADGYELTALTANGEDILGTKRCTITEATTIEATFVDHTNVVTVGGHAVRIYPNPAKTFVFIEGLQPDSQVMLYSMEGEQLYAGQTDRQGVLQIYLTALSDGVYLLVGQGWQKRLVVKQ